MMSWVHTLDRRVSELTALFIHFTALTPPRCSWVKWNWSTFEGGGGVGVVWNEVQTLRFNSEAPFQGLKTKLTSPEFKSSFWILWESRQTHRPKFRTCWHFSFVLFTPAADFWLLTQTEYPTSLPLKALSCLPGFRFLSVCTVKHYQSSDQKVSNITTSEFVQLLFTSVTSSIITTDQCHWEPPISPTCLTVDMVLWIRSHPKLSHHFLSLFCYRPILYVQRMSFPNSLAALNVCFFYFWESLIWSLFPKLIYGLTLCWTCFICSHEIFYLRYDSVLHIFLLHWNRSGNYPPLFWGPVFFWVSQRFFCWLFCFTTMWSVHSNSFQMQMMPQMESKPDLWPA